MTSQVAERLFSLTPVLDPLQSDLDASVEDAAFGVGVDFPERRILLGTNHDLAEATLPGVGDVLRVDEEAVFSERLLPEKAELPVRLCLGAVAQQLPAGVIRLDA